MARETDGKPGTTRAEARHIIAMSTPMYSSIITAEATEDEAIAAGLKVRGALPRWLETTAAGNAPMRMPAYALTWAEVDGLCLYIEALEAEIDAANARQMESELSE